MDIIKNEKKELLLEDEKKKIEAKIFEVIEQKKEQEEKKVEIEKDVNAKSLKKSKIQLINEFLELQKTVAKKDEKGDYILEHTEYNLKKLTKPEIIKLIAEYANKKLSNDFTEKIESATSQVSKDPSKPLPIEDLMALGMHNMNMCVLSILEATGNAFKHKTGDFNVLEDLTGEAEKKREAFLVIFKQIYKDHATEINTYLSPLVQYGIILTQCCTTTIIKNCTKKKEVAETK